MISLTINTHQRVEFIDITRQVGNAWQSDCKIRNGHLLVFVPHTTAGITINENADPDVIKDIIKTLNHLVPFDSGYAHREGNSAAHVKASLTGASAQVIINNGRMVLGSWQGIFFCEFDGPRNRQIHLDVIEKTP